MFFSVTNTIRIGRKVYTPCVCYKLTESLEATVEQLKAKGKAEIYKEAVFFQNGKLLPAKKKAVVKKNKKSANDWEVKAETKEPVDEGF